MRSMTRSRPVTVAIALVLVVALGWSAAAACADLTPSSAPEMACCLMGHDDCDHASATMTCCASPDPQPGDRQSPSVAPTPSKFVPVLDLVRLVDPVSVILPTAERILRSIDHVPVRQPDTPTYLLDSVFRL